MRRLSIVLVAAALVALSVPSQAASVHERNTGFFWSLVGEQDPLQPATMPDGRVVTLDEAIDALATRAGSVDLAAMAAGQATGPLGFHAGDLWLFALGSGGCTATQIAPGSPGQVPLDPQFFLYQGGIGSMSAHADILEVYAWTTKEGGSYTDVDWTATGHLDFFCISFGGSYLAFPFVNGIVTVS